MGIYHDLYCRSCDIALSLGKKLFRGRSVELQGPYSEEKRRWLKGDDAYAVLAQFLLDHEEHEIVFSPDTTAEIQEAPEADVDLLLSRYQSKG